jgi:hypothetical protein
MQEYRAGTGAYDALNVIPAWMPDLVQAGALEPLDAFVDKYGYEPEHDILVKALAGGDDDWKGIRGIGAKGAVRILQDASWYWHLVIEHPKVKPHADKVVNAVQVMDFWAPDVEDTEFPVKAIAPSTFHQTRVAGALGITRHFWFSHADGLVK